MEIEPLRILLADDDESDRLLFKEAFGELKIKTSVHTLNNGVQLMERLYSKDLRLPNLIFLDLNMPLKNGMECLKEIRSNEKLKDISIAIYSTSDNEKDLDETFSNGANIYITKPDNFDKLRQVLEKAVLTAYMYKDKSMERDNFFLKIK